uniref:Uncharacterized protein n=1 Tax=Timema tahoe TaxID=61484 RepID=A0A7R9FGL5_9NEOP|nr:unnamed protein product [Timema tahoe]
MYQVFNLDSNDKTQLSILKKKQARREKVNSFENGQTLGQSNKKIKTFKCKICDNIFGSSLERQVHTLSHKDQNEWVCPTCKRKFAIKKYLLRHLPSHVLGRNLGCETCGRKFRKQFELRSHKRIHTGEGVYTCVKCGKKFVHKSILNNHLRYHAKEYSCTCNICALVARTLGLELNDKIVDLFKKEHLEPEFGKINPQRLVPVLDDNGYILSERASSLSYHKKVHTGENKNTVKHECVVCCKFYVNLTIHLKRHTGERNFLCDLCGKKFRDNMIMPLHQRETGGVPPLQENFRLEDDYALPYAHPHRRVKLCVHRV